MENTSKPVNIYTQHIWIGFVTGQFESQIERQDGVGVILSQSTETDLQGTSLIRTQEAPITH